MKIVVTTPTGNIGSRVVQLLLQAGARPTLLARHPERLDSRVLERAQVVQTDLADSDAVVRATRGADALFWLAPFNADPSADPVAWYAELGCTAELDCAWPLLVRNGANRQRDLAAGRGLPELLRWLTDGTERSVIQP